MSNDDYKTLSDVREIYCYIMEIRLQLWLKPNDTFDIPMIEKVKTTWSQNIKSMLQLLDGEKWKIDFINLMNTLY